MCIVPHAVNAVYIYPLIHFVIWSENRGDHGGFQSGASQASATRGGQSASLSISGFYAQIKVIHATHPFPVQSHTDRRKRDIAHCRCLRVSGSTWTFMEMADGENTFSASMCPEGYKDE